MGDSGRSEMEEFSGDGWVSPAVDMWENGGNVRPPSVSEAVVMTATVTPLTVSGSFKEGKGSRRRAPLRPSMDADEFINLLHGSDPVKVELNRLENEVRGEGKLIRSFYDVVLDVVLLDLVVDFWCLFLQIRIENWATRMRRSRH